MYREENMADFFRGIPDRMEIFGGLHIGISAFFLAAAVLIFIFRKRLARLDGKIVRRVMAGILTANMLIHYVSRLILGIWSFGEDLPLHICFVTNFLLIYILLTDDKLGLFRVVYYFTLIGPLPAMIWPDLSYSWQSYTFWQFVISHHFMLLCSLFCMFVFGYSVRLRSIFPAFFFGNIYIGAVWIFNAAFGTNYIMMEELPQQLYEIYPFLDRLPPLAWLELVGAAVLLAAYLPALLAKKRGAGCQND